ncbi:MAG: HNH endonuclease [Pseudomonadota bacterium]|nr:HNH endonuclease [Pseudomonadota bacterium]
MIPSDKSRVVERAAFALEAGDRDSAIHIAKSDYPWESAEVPKRKMTQRRSLQIFVRDGFIDRYSGSQLIFPGALLLLSRELPEAFPAHETWRSAQTHDAYFELWPVVDHVEPLSRGGADDESNFATTSNLLNEAKSNWSLEQLGWKLLPPGDISKWDGLLGWFARYVTKYPEVLEHKTINSWFRSAVAVNAV